MRRFAFIFGAAMPLIGALPAQAEDVVIRIEAKRGSEVARSSAEDWGARFDDVVTFPLADGWVGIALGPMPREQAAARLSQLKAEGKVPGDSFIAPVRGRLTVIAAGPAPSAPAEAPTGAPTGAGAGPTFPAAASAAEPTDTAAAEPETVADPPAPPLPVVAPEPIRYFLRLESSTDRAKAEEMLATWRETLPEVGLWTLPNGRSVVALGPMDEATGKAWLAAFRKADAVPRDAFLEPQDKMGQAAIAGIDPGLPPPPAAPAEMPTLEQIQRALRWAGHYDGAIDGKDGPMTQSAIAAEIVRLRASPDTATAMHELIRRRDAWRDEMGLAELRDDHTGLALPAPMDRLQFDRTERALSIYGPRDGSGAALILFSQPGDQQEMLDLAGLITALGWVPAPTRQINKGSAILDGRNQTHIGRAEARVIDGHVQGFVLIWPARDPEEQRRMAAEISDNLTRFSPSRGELAAQQAATDAQATPSVLPQPLPAQQ